ncbi:MAG: hypothetical protein JHC26_09870 [Thermofilum sp.]|jgi:hypothetical protein|uniref:hypothetical protein n=1 Tax=Thermofilum sp. TaxID=1961369 RepID=UPI002584620D|nr:hypothetical protein [Thermofilum sp.]MCI4409389.1 hypothetical protein [Thermofilum sp.]
MTTQENKNNWNGRTVYFRVYDMYKYSQLYIDFTQCPEEFHNDGLKRPLFELLYSGLSASNLWRQALPAHKRIAKEIEELASMFRQGLKPVFPKVRIEPTLEFSVDVYTSFVAEKETIQLLVPQIRNLLFVFAENTGAVIVEEMFFKDILLSRWIYPLKNMVMNAKTVVPNEA